MNEAVIEKHITEQLKENATLEVRGPYTVEELITRPERVEAIDLIERLKRYRGHISELGEIVIEFRKSDIQHACDVNEARANLTLAFRHLEDARTRLGKAIESLDGSNQQPV